jgi:calreticulin
MNDPDDKKPDDWDKPEHIPDPDAKKPDDWDDEMDGDWEPPQIDNPEYKVNIGCHSRNQTHSRAAN